MLSSSRPASVALSNASSTTLNSTNSENIDWQDPIKQPAPAPSRIGRTHQRTRTNIDLPPLLTNPSRLSILSPFRSDKDRSPSTSPPRSPTHEVDDLDFGDEEGSGIRLEHKSSKIQSWFSGHSEPISIGLIPSPSRERSNPLEKKVVEQQEQQEQMDQRRQSHQPSSGHLQQAPAKLQKRMSASPTRLAQATSAARFSFFRMRNTPAAPAPQDLADELASLDIKAALFPSGPSDEFSPAAFMNLQMNAEGTLNKFQNAYKQATRSLREVTSARNVQKDELLAAQTANEAIKMQLAEMADRATEQENAMRKLAAELASEKQRRKEEEELRKRSVKMIPSTMDESLETPTRRRHRQSQALSAGDSEADSEVASSAESIFSAPLGRPVDMSRTNSVASATPTTQASFSPDTVQRQCFSPGLQSPTKDRRHTVDAMGAWALSPEDCGICHGVPSSEAWDILGVLKEENMSLKSSIEQLEAGLDASLDLVYGIA